MKLEKEMEYRFQLLRGSGGDRQRIALAELESTFRKMLAVIEAAKKIWDADEFSEDEDSRIEFIPGDLMLPLGNALEKLEGKRKKCKHEWTFFKEDDDPLGYDWCFLCGDKRAHTWSEEE